MIKKIIFLILFIQIIILTLFKQELVNYLISITCTILYGGSYMLFENKIYDCKEKYPFDVVKVFCLSICFIISFIISILFNVSVFFNVVSYLLCIILVYVLSLLVLMFVKINKHVVDESIKNDKKTNEWQKYTSKIKLLYEKNNADELKTLYEKMRYSDPVCVGENTYDEDIFKMIDNLDCSDLEQINKIKEKINERNENLKNIK